MKSCYVWCVVKRWPSVVRAPVTHYRRGLYQQATVVFNKHGHCYNGCSFLETLFDKTL